LYQYVGDQHNLALKSDGSIVAWGGNNAFGEHDVPSPNENYIAIAAGTYTSAAIRTVPTLSVADVEASQGATSNSTHLPLSVHSITPNPFHSQTSIALELVRPTEIVVRVYGPTGRLVRSLREQAVSAGRQEIVWDGKNDRGEEVAAGSYLLRCSTATGETQIAKIIRLQ
jgi:hypothetical protein